MGLVNSCIKRRQSESEDNSVHEKNRIVINFEGNLNNLTLNLNNNNIRRASKVDFSKFSQKIVTSKIDQNIVDKVLNSGKIEATSVRPVKKTSQIKEKLLCLFCGGSKCKYETWDTQENSLIKGLNSGQLIENIFSSQRLSNRLITEYNITNQLKNLKIGVILNLQSKGEHPLCGDKIILESGFSYNPEILTLNGFHYIHFPWKEKSGVNDYNNLIDLIKNISDFVRQSFNILVHCHSGLGRSTMFAICYQIFYTSNSYDEIIMQIKEKRNSINMKSNQTNFLYGFKEYIDRKRIIFTSIPLQIETFIENQNLLLDNYELNRYQTVPKLICCVLDQVIEIKKAMNLDNLTIFKSFYFLESWNEKKEKKILEYKSKVNKGDLSFFQKENNLSFYLTLFYDFLEDSVEITIPPDSIYRLFKVISPNELKTHLIDLSRDTDFPNKFWIAIKAHFSTIELSILIRLGLFLMEIQPNDEEEKYFYQRMIEKVCCHLCNINLEKIIFKIQLNPENFSNNHLPVEIRYLLETFSLLMNYITAILMKNENSQPLQRSNNTNVAVYNTNHSKLTVRSKSSNFKKNPKFTNSENNMKKSSTALKTNHHAKSTFVCADKEEQEMYEFYKILQNHYENKSIYSLNRPNRIIQNFNEDIFASMVSLNNTSKPQNQGTLSLANSIHTVQNTFNDNKSLFNECNPELLEKFKIFITNENKKNVSINENKNIEISLSSEPKFYNTNNELRKENLNFKKLMIERNTIIEESEYGNSLVKSKSIIDFENKNRITHGPNSIISKSTFRNKLDESIGSVRNSVANSDQRHLNSKHNREMNHEKGKSISEFRALNQSSSRPIVTYNHIKELEEKLGIANTNTVLNSSINSDFKF